MKTFLKLLIFFTMFLNATPSLPIEQMTSEIVLKEADVSFLKALKPETTSEISACFMQLLAGQNIFNKRELMLRELSKHQYYHQNFDLLNRLNSENFEINGHLADYILAFRVLYGVDHFEFNHPQEFIDRLQALLNALQLKVPSCLFHQIQLMSHYLSYEKWTNCNGQKYWYNYAITHQDQLLNVESDWLNFLEVFPEFIKNTHSHQVHREVFINFLRTL